MRIVHCMRDHYTHYIGRPHKEIPRQEWEGSVFGNPFPLYKESERAVVIRRFEDYARSTPSILDAIAALPEDAVLGCWCAPKPCHGAIIVTIWKELHS